MRVLNEKYLLKEAARSMVPPSILRRSKQPYRAPDGKSFFGRQMPDYVSELLSPSALKQHGIFNSDSVTGLVAKFKSGRGTSTKDNMALVGVLSTQLMAHKFLAPAQKAMTPEVAGVAG
jgi:asparagine synthase (glutamine-hydrolysing)